MSTKEFWKDVIGYEGLYIVSNYGNIVSLERSVPFRNSEKIVPRYEMQKRKNDRGYLTVILSKLGKRKTTTIHRLVAFAFVCNPNNKPEVNHIDGDKNNNNANNLEWSTRQENIIHSFKSGLNKITDSQKKIASDLAKKRTGIHSHVSKIIVNKENGVFYYSTRDAANSTGIDEHLMSKMLRGIKPNKTKLIYA